MKKIIVFIFVIIILIMPYIAKADILLAGQKPLEYCAKVDNIKQYPDYTFLIYPTGMSGGYQIVEENQCLLFYKFAPAKFYAIKSSIFYENTVTLETNEGQKKFFSQNQGLIPSETILKSETVTNEADPKKSVEHIYSVKLISKNGLKIEETQTITTYEDGSKKVDKKSFPSLINLPFNFSLTNIGIIGLGFLILIIGIIIGGNIAARNSGKNQFRF